ncbi:hypothetical protein OE88DRAFT_1650873 [Heliocybe sulcata]|uniref:Fungal-type protein kinase domain-containing protein n=1 Tax=Heliocybe sulcata TaxID=5364 RepID=A0A5C3NL88_9AGAM|nr:hypothetical protein OE88DRAFT_1650873 [Heliocybe sulcata]
MPWPPQIIRQFEKVPPNPSEREYYGPYNKLLCTVFPPDTDFTVVPQYMPILDDLNSAANCLAMFEVQFADKPVFAVELKPSGHLRCPSARKVADQQVRCRIWDIKGMIASTICSELRAYRV